MFHSSKVITLTLCLLFSSTSSYASASDNIMVGEVAKNTLLNGEQVFNAGYQSFVVSDKNKALISTWPDNLHIDIFFGTWCHDSQREVPKLLSILEHNNKVTSTLIALDYDKDDPELLAKENGIKYTPTFIVYLGEEEVGRIIERPTLNLVDDITTLIIKSDKLTN